MKELILFVCNGNIHRSVIAEEIFRELLISHNDANRFMVSSCGLQGTMGTEKPKYDNLLMYEDEWKAAKPSLDRYKIDVTKHIAKPISLDQVMKASLIIAMDKLVYSDAENSLLTQFAQHKDKIHFLGEFTSDSNGIKDPAGNNSETLHQNVIDSIYKTLHSSYEDIINLIK